MAKSSDLNEDRKPPRRRINKQQAIRHLLHAAIRLVMKEEDPFAIHLIIHSADKMILDIAKSRGVYPRVDWELYIKDEFHKDFFARHRETYNYLKHAKDDFADDLPVHDIMMMNVMALFIAIANYADLFKERTDHMTLFTYFVMYLSPAVIGPQFPNRDELLRTISTSQSMTPRAFFEVFSENPSVMPKLIGERSEDRQDVIHFTICPLASFAKGERQAP